VLGAKNAPQSEKIDRFSKKMKKENEKRK